MFVEKRSCAKVITRSTIDSIRSRSSTASANSAASSSATLPW